MSSVISIPLAAARCRPGLPARASRGRGSMAAADSGTMGRAAQGATTVADVRQRTGRGNPEVLVESPSTARVTGRSGAAAPCGPAQLEERVLA